MCSSYVRVAKPRMISSMVREDFDDFVAALKALFPETVFFSKDDKAKGDYRVYPDPFAWFEARSRMSFTAMFRVPSSADLEDGRPEVLSGGAKGPLSTYTAADYVHAGRWGNVSSFATLKRFDEAIIDASGSSEFTDSGGVHLEQISHLRVFDLPTVPRTEVSLCYDRDDPLMVDWARQVREIWSSLVVRTISITDVVSGQVVETVTLKEVGVSKRIMDACATMENLCSSIKYHRGLERYFADGPTESYRKKARKRLGLS